MGRKPNPIVSKYFTRGAKIEDASNRYSYICGERFPKGRIDTLYSHITNKCTALSWQQKKDLVLQIHDHALAVDGASAAKNKQTVEMGKTASVVLPSQQQNTNSLDVLAEASQQHSYPPPYSVPCRPSYQTSFPPDDPSTRNSIVLDPALRDEIFTSNFFLMGENNDSSQELRESADRSLVALKLTSAGASSSGLTSSAALFSMPKSPRRSLVHTSLNAVSHSNDASLRETPFSSQSDSLRSIAASANARLAKVMNSNASKPMYEKGNFSSAVGIAATDVGQQATCWTPVTGAVKETFDVGQDEKLLSQKLAAAYPRLIAINPLTVVNDLPSESSQEWSDQKAKVRARFTEARKEEIKKMRQIGSCVRCRMLKKPCSAVIPCVTCSAVDSPRTWKGFHCLRVKLGDMYQGYMLGLHQAISVCEMNAVKSNTRFIQGPCTLRVKYFAEADPIELNALVTYVSEPSVDHPFSVVQNGQSSAVKTVILDNEASDLPTIFEEYIQKEAAHFFEQEESPIIKSAAMLVHQYGQESEDVLLKTVADLWMSTTMISDPRKVWSISALEDVSQGSSDFHNNKTAAGRPANGHIDQQSYALIMSQLKSGLERLATKLSTHAMNKFEKRMLRPVSSNQFETFLIAFILINCVERHSWIFHNWTDRLRAERWPLNQPPADIITQAEQATSVIAFMINIRNLTSKTTETAAGGVLQAEHPTDKKYAEWFGEIGVTVHLLAERRDNAVFDAGDCRSLDLKYSAALLLPPA